MLFVISADQAVQQDFKEMFEKLMNEYFPVQSVEKLVKTGLSDLQAASSTISGASNTYLSTLISLQNLQEGKYKFKYCNKKTGTTTYIYSHFFSDDQVQQAIELGEELSKAA